GVRVACANCLSSLYLRVPVSAQLPFSSIPAMPAPPTPIGFAATAPETIGEVDPSEAQAMMDRGQLGAARRMLLRALAADANNGMAQQLLPDVEARIRIRLPQTIRELENALAVSPKADRARYLQVRERLMEITLMSDVGDQKVAELRT